MMLGELDMNFLDKPKLDKPKNTFLDKPKKYPKVKD